MEKKIRVNLLYQLNLRPNFFMNLQAKISAALAFLFAIILLLGGLGAYYLTELSTDSEAILQDNYISLEYGSSMQKALADLQNKSDESDLADFERALKKEETNITEVGEGAEATAVRREFNRLRTLLPTDPGRQTTIERIRAGLFRIDDINRHAIVRKNEVAKRTAKDALVWLAAVGTLCFLIVLSFIVNFPAYIARPLRELTQGIKQVASRNFEERLHLDRKSVV